MISTVTLSADDRPLHAPRLPGKHETAVCSRCGDYSFVGLQVTRGIPSMTMELVYSYCLRCAELVTGVVSESVVSFEVKS